MHAGPIDVCKLLWCASAHLKALLVEPREDIQGGAAACRHGGQQVRSNHTQAAHKHSCHLDITRLTVLVSRPAKLDGTALPTPSGAAADSVPVDAHL
jgi:hypothetical protein